MQATELTKRHWLLIFTLSLLTFVLGTSEFVIVGILTDISSSLHMTNAKAGTLVSAFAITFAIATPIVMSATSHFPKRKWMLFLIGSFIIFNALCVISTSYIMLLGLRMLTAIVTGVLISLAMIVASETMPIAKRGLAISFVFGGFTLANVVGVPIGTVIAEWYNWHGTFILTTIFGGFAFLASFFILPDLKSQNRSSMRDQFALLTHPRILMAFFIPALGFGATYTVFTYLVPILKGMEAPNSSISLILFAYGFISIFSNILAGKIASHNPIGRLRFVFFVQAIVLMSLYWTTSTFTLGLFNIGLMSLMAIMLTTSTQLYLIDLARIYQPKATGLAASLMPVASNVGIALGSALGGLVYHQGNLMNVTWVGGLVAISASLLTFFSHRLDQKQLKSS
ncbi:MULTISPECIES: MFS transporter [unclassified Bacillus (in: firmicutes)]|uniref:MFS transporter n=1 Tax=unclassified Bacillus (in: firmicutes) TaxID=185979 RepID=UPI0008E84C3B|nr:MULTISPECIES: MFS transporter [unclassified Bacillus (in: firmicutes)]SFA90725.1 Predicted arabinose efflux permease, MFS family [Bacillus sp. UNCCL13]SFQ85355.1 Predicted arabinose efflux permease, MFS family [Bacillus sp. cl95]